MPDVQPLPPAFNPDQETDKFLAKLKKKASTNFSWTKKDALKNAEKLAYWLYVFERENQALEVCRFLGTLQFSGNFNLWTWVELTLVLQSRILRLRHQESEAADCLKRIDAAGFVAERLTGRLLDGQLESMQEAVTEKDKTGEREWAMIALSESCFVLELGGSAKWPVEKVEQQIGNLLVRLRNLAK
jgi:hypothetical protein